MHVRVAITGTLSRPRREVIQMIETRTNAVYVDYVDERTDYLVAARSDTNKAQAAAEIGVRVISEAELHGFIDAGHIPPRLARPQADLRNPEELASLYNRIAREMSFCPRPPLEAGEWDIVWTEELPVSKAVSLTYEDFEGKITSRIVIVVCRGVAPRGVRYWGAYDGNQFKTFREDRIIDFEALPDSITATLIPR